MTGARMSPEEQDQLRRLAKHAVHFPPMSAAWMAYHASVEPGVVLALLDEVGALTRPRWRLPTLRRRAPGLG